MKKYAPVWLFGIIQAVICGCPFAVLGFNGMASLSVMLMTYVALVLGFAILRIVYWRFSRITSFYSTAILLGVAAILLGAIFGLVSALLFCMVVQFGPFPLALLIGIGVGVLLGGLNTYLWYQLNLI